MEPSRTFSEQKQEQSKGAAYAESSSLSSGLSLPPPPLFRSNPPVQREEGEHQAQDRRGEETTRRRETGDGVRRNEPGSAGYDHFDSDWVGRAILERYLIGGGDWTINADPSWSDYMRANASLKSLLADRLCGIAQRISATPGTHNIDETFHGEMENGEGIVGYQYLHGTNANAGDFQITGLAEVTQSGDQTTVRFDVAYIWNDSIDPNGQYSTDNIKNTFAELITLGNAEAYDIHIIWTDSSNLTIDSTSGDITPGSGYPIQP